MDVLGPFHAPGLGALNGARLSCHALFLFLMPEGRKGKRHGKKGNDCSLPKWGVPWRGFYHAALRHPQEASTRVEAAQRFPPDPETRRADRTRSADRRSGKSSNS